MILSVNEKKALLQRQKELEDAVSLVAAAWRGAVVRKRRVLRGARARAWQAT